MDVWHICFNFLYIALFCCIYPPFETHIWNSGDFCPIEKTSCAQERTSSYREARITQTMRATTATTCDGELSCLPEQQARLCAGRWQWTDAEWWSEMMTHRAWWAAAAAAAAAVEVARLPVMPSAPPALWSQLQTSWADCNYTSLINNILSHSNVTQRSISNFTVNDF